jgi:hypothetical protein
MILLRSLQVRESSTNSKTIAPQGITHAIQKEWFEISEWCVVEQDRLLFSVVDDMKDEIFNLEIGKFRLESMKPPTAIDWDIAILHTSGRPSYRLRI